MKKPPQFRSKLKWELKDFEYEVLRRARQRVKKGDSKAVRQAVEEAALREVTNELWHEYYRMEERIKQNILYSIHLVEEEMKENEWHMRHLLILGGRLLENKEVQS